MADRNHMLALPRFIRTIRAFQLATAVAVMGLSAYGVTYFSFDGVDLTLFTALASIIIVVYVIVATRLAPVAYNYWAILGLDTFAVIFWLISFALLASEVASYPLTTTYSYTSCYFGYCFKNKRDGVLSKRTTDVYTFRNAMAAAAGLGGLEFVLFIITLVFTGIHLHRHRKAGGHCMPYNSEAAFQMEQQPVTSQPAQPVYRQPAAVYQQQPVQNQQQPVQYQQQPVTHQEQPPPQHHTYQSTM